MWAASEGHEVVETLVTAGAGINLRGSAGDTALHLAVLSVKKSAQRVVKRLLAAGADPAITNAAGHAAGAWARLQGRADMAALIQSAGRGTPCKNTGKTGQNPGRFGLLLHLLRCPSWPSSCCSFFRRERNPSRFHPTSCGTRLRFSSKRWPWASHPVSESS